jgi:hypothetical protein
VGNGQPLVVITLRPKAMERSSRSLRAKHSSQCPGPTQKISLGNTRYAGLQGAPGNYCARTREAFEEKKEGRRISEPFYSPCGLASSGNHQQGKRESRFTRTGAERQLKMHDVSLTRTIFLKTANTCFASHRAREYRKDNDRQL